MTKNAQELFQLHELSQLLVQDAKLGDEAIAEQLGWKIATVRARKKQLATQAKEELVELIPLHALRQLKVVEAMMQKALGQLWRPLTAKDGTPIYQLDDEGLPTSIPFEDIDSDVANHVKWLFEHHAKVTGILQAAQKAEQPDEIEKNIPIAEALEKARKARERVLNHVKEAEVLSS